MGELSQVKMPVRYAAAQVFWFLSGYRSVRSPIAVPGVVVAAPHTSNWDFLFMLAIAWDARVPLRWLGKQELFKGAFGPVMRRLGGIPVNRADPGDLVVRVVESFRTEKPFALVITPEGTRRGSGWKSGFRRIALGANVPISLGFVDRISRTSGIGPVLHLTEDVHVDMDAIRAFYADKNGLKPELRTEPRLREEM